MPTGYDEIGRDVRCDGTLSFPCPTYHLRDRLRLDLRPVHLHRGPPVQPERPRLDLRPVGLHGPQRWTYTQTTGTLDCGINQGSHSTKYRRTH
ncbi:hypothetical protein [Streptosporangium saharense]|uniref:hypothetical protein n=1 Tax=Streptosporangium saharense TaxID=1706840 RepID=UPI00342486E2